MADKPRIRVPAVRGFDAGKRGRRLNSIPSATQAINTQIRFYGATALARSRYLVANNPYASAAKEGFVAALVGDGIKPSSLLLDPDMKDEIQQAWLEWTDEADADWLTNFYGIQSLIAAEMFEAGECFVRLRARRVEDNLSVPLQLQLIPSEMLPLSDNRDNFGGSRVEMGIEFDQIGRRRAYHFLRQHPGDMARSMMIGETSRVPADEILHLFRPTVAGQIRGVPHTISAIAKLAMMDQYDDAELERKRTAALFGGFIKRQGSPDLMDDEETPLDSFLDGIAGGEQSGIGMEPGAFVSLEPGEDVEFSEPADVGGNYETFQYRTLTAIASGFGVPYAAMTGDLRKTSYSSIRAGLVDFRRRVQAVQKHVMIFQFCRPVWARWMADAVNVGAITSIMPAQMVGQQRAFIRAKWIPPKWEWVDPLDDLKAEKLAVDNGYKARSDVIEATGEDPEEVDRRIMADREREERLGLVFAGTDPVREPRAPATPEPDAAPANNGGNVNAE